MRTALESDWTTVREKERSEMYFDLFDRRVTYEGCIWEFPARGPELFSNPVVKTANSVHELAPRALII